MLKPPTSPTASVTPSNSSGWLVHQEAGAPGAPGFLVGGEREHDVAGRRPVFAQPLAHHREHHRVHVLHVDRAAAPHAAIRDLPGEWVVPPVRRAGRHHVQVTVHQQARPFAVPTADPGHHAGSLGMRFQDRRLEAYLGQQAGHVFGGQPLAGARVVAGVRRVDPDQVTADVHNLVLRGHLVRCHRPIVALGSSGSSGQCRLAGDRGEIHWPAGSPEAVRFAKVSQPMRTPHRASGWRNRQTR